MTAMTATDDAQPSCVLARILLAEDDDDLRTLLSLKLRDAGFDVTEVSDGQGLLQRLMDGYSPDGAYDPFDMVLSDINMPGMTGLELLPKAKAARPDVPVIMITAYGDAETKRKALEGGAEALFTKPIDFGALRGECPRGG